MLKIERVDYSHLTGRPDLRDGAEEFDQNVTYPFEQTVFFTKDEFEDHQSRLETASDNPRTFIIGALTALLDTRLKRLPDEYIALIESIHLLYEKMGIDNYSCFRREKYGAIGISSAHATILDRLALDTSRFLTLLPGASNSQGTWKEIAYGARRGTGIVGLFRQDDPEIEFRGRIMEAAAAHGGTSDLTFITFRTPSEMLQGLELVADNLSRNNREIYREMM